MIVQILHLRGEIFGADRQVPAQFVGVGRPGSDVVIHEDGQAQLPVVRVCIRRGEGGERRGRRRSGERGEGRRDKSRQVRRRVGGQQRGGGQRSRGNGDQA